MDRRSRRWVGLAALAAGVLCLVVVLIPVAESRGVGAAPWLRLAMRPACHQISHRCLDLGYGPLAVCARCTGLYIGGFAGLLISVVAGRRFRPNFRLIALAAAPSIVDFILGQLGLPSVANWPRCVLASVPGLLLGLLLADAIAAAVGDPGESRSVPIT